MPISRYLILLKAERTERFQKLLDYSKFLELLTTEENLQISQEFYERFPSDEEFKPLNEVLKEMVERKIIPDSVLVEALDEYFRFRVKSAVL